MPEWGRDTCAHNGVAGKENHPINCVDWQQANAYCQAVGKRLPTEEEWEYAARGGSKGWTFPWGNAEPSYQRCWSGTAERSETCPVGSFPEDANPWGVRDLSGNVQEWTASGWSDDYSKSRTEQLRVVRGGSVLNATRWGVRGANRTRLDPSHRDLAIGFRCATTP